MSIRPVDTNLIVPRTVEIGRDTAVLANKAAVSQQFSVAMTDEEQKHKQEMTVQVIEDQKLGQVDENGHNRQDGQQKKDQQHEKKEPDEFSLTSMMIDIRI